MLNVVVLMGRLVADPELKKTPGGVSVCSFRIAVDRSYTKDGERKADFLDIVAWRQSAEFVCKYFRKGNMIALTGQVQTRSYEDKNGSRRTAVEIAAQSVSFAGGKEGAEPPKAPHTGTQAAQGAYTPASGKPDVQADDFAVIEDGEDLPF